MTNRLNRFVPASLCVALVMFIAGCNGEAETSTDARTASASDQAQTERDDNDSAAVDRRRQAAEQLRREARDEAQRRRVAIDDRARTSPGSATRDRRDRDVVQRERQDERASTDFVIQAEPTLLDLGDMGTREERSGVVTLRNVGDRPMMIERAATDCGCTVANVPEGRYLEPGESVDVDVSLRGGSREQTLRKHVTFFFSDQPTIRVPVVGHVKSYVSVEPQRFRPEELLDGRIVLRAEDGEMFRVVSVSPDVAEILSDEPATEHEVIIDWDVWEIQRQPRQVRFELDHPRANQSVVNIHVPRQVRDDALAGRTSLRDQERQLRAQIQEAMQAGNVERLENLIVDDEVDVSTTDSAGMPLLGVAARTGQVEMMKMLLEHGADVNATDRGGRTALMEAGREGRHEAVRVLLDAGADLSMRDRTLGGTALAWAAGFGNAESVRLMLEAGADKEVVSESTGYTPLIWAAGHGSEESVRLLIEAGANIEAVDATQQMTPIVHAARRGSAEAVRMLAEAGANLDRTDVNGRNAIILAAGSNDAKVDVIDALIESGADVRATDRFGLSALDHARGRTDEHAAAVVERLEELLGANAGAEVDSDSSNGQN